MVSEQLGTMLRQLRRLIGGQQAESLPDAQLLARFVAEHDEAAFAALVERHGPMVLGVCRRVLDQPQDVEDTFQATFLVLVRKAASLGNGEVVASWLYGVAYRTASRARAHAARRRSKERQVVTMPAADPIHEVIWRDLRPVLDEEVGRLPVKYRSPVVLCYLEGKTYAEAAQQLGWPEGTVSGRLARARELLRVRLARRGVTLATGALVAVLAQEAAAVPPALLTATVQAAALVAAGKGVAEGLSATVAALVEGVVHEMFLIKIKMAAVVFLAIGVGLGAGVVAYQTSTGKSADAPKQAAARPAAQGDQPARADLHGDPLPPGAVARLGTLRFRHGQHIQAIAFSPDGKAIASAGEDGRIVLHDPATGKKLRSFQGEATYASSLAFAPDGKRLAAGVSGRLVYVWDVETGQLARQFQIAEGPVRYVAFGADSRTLAGASFQRAAHVWDVVTGKEICRIVPPREIAGVALTPDGKTLVTAELAGNHTAWLRLWETAGGRELHQWQAHQGEVCSLAFSPNGKRLASACFEGENRLRLWEVPTGKLQLDLPGEFRALGFSPCGKVLTATAGETVFLMEADTGKDIRRIPGGRRAAFSPDGKVLALADSWTIALWDAATGKQLGPALSGHDQVVENVMFFPDCKTVASTSRKAVHFWEVSTGRKTKALEGFRPYPLTISADGKLLAAVSKTQSIELWDAAAGKKLRELPAPSQYSLMALVLSPDGKTLAAAIGDRTVRFWEVATGKPLRSISVREEPVQSLAFSPDGRTLALGGGERDPTVRLCDVASGQEVREPFAMPQGAAEVAFSPDGRILAAATTGAGYFYQGHTIRVWIMETGQLIRQLDDVSSCFALSPDGKSVATPGPDLRVWEVATGKVRVQSKGHSDTIWRTAYSPDGRLLASGSQDTTVLVWDVRNLNAEKPAGKVSREEQEALWTDLTGEDAARAYRAIETLIAGPERTVPFLRQHLRPVHAPDPKHLARLIADLDAERFAARETATRELEHLGPLARPALRQALAAQPSPEVRRRAEQLLERLQTFVLSTEELRAWRAVEVLEQIGTPEARLVLETLAQGAPGSRQTQDAKAALQRLAARPAISP